MTRTFRRNSITFGTYIRQLIAVVFSSSLVLGLIIGVSLLIGGETTMEIDLTFDFGTYDGLWWIIGLPLLSVLLFGILSPLSFFVHRQLSK